MTAKKETTLRTAGLGLVVTGSAIISDNFVVGALIVFVGLVVYFAGHADHPVAM